MIATRGRLTPPRLLTALQPALRAAERRRLKAKWNGRRETGALFVCAILPREASAPLKRDALPREAPARLSATLCRAKRRPREKATLSRAKRRPRENAALSRAKRRPRENAALSRAKRRLERREQPRRRSRPRVAGNVRSACISCYAANAL